MKVIMYHYVRAFNKNLPFFRYLNIENFKKQLDYFEKNFGFLKKNEFKKYFLDNDFEGFSGKILLTFDDAMSCHYKYVFPELIKRNIFGCFYIPTMPYIDEKILDVHRIHLLCGFFEGKKLLENAFNLISDSMIALEKRNEFNKKLNKKQKNYEGITEFKKLLNYFIKEEYRTEVLDTIFTNLSFDYKFVAFL